VAAAADLDLQLKEAFAKVEAQRTREQEITARSEDLKLGKSMAEAKTGVLEDKMAALRHQVTRLSLNPQP
jgi:hypothetical protein